MIGARFINMFSEKKLFGQMGPFWVQKGLILITPEPL